MSTDKPNIYKIGKSKDTQKRKNQLQTATVDDIDILYNYATSDDTLLEYIIHNILDQYRSKREHFSANIEYIKLIIQITGDFIDTIKSTYFKRLINTKNL